eukprot:gene5431-6586_t
MGPSPGIFNTGGFHDPNAMCSCNSHMLMEWGQFLDHDISFTPQVVLGSQKCASNCSMDNTDMCYPIPILEGDPDFQPGSCIKFTRSDAACGTGLGITGAECDVADSKGIRVTKQREQLNGISSYIDASQVYGSSQAHADALRVRAAPRSPRRGRLIVCDEACMRRVFSLQGLPGDLAAGLGDFPPFDFNAKGGEGSGDADDVGDDAACTGGLSETDENAQSCDLPGTGEGASAGPNARQHATCNATCTGKKKATTGNCGGQLPCFSVGDVRGNENIGLTSLQTLFLREHNRIAGILSQLNPSWSDEEVYQETRKIVGAEMQILTYKEYYPANMGIGASHFIPETPLDHLACPSHISGDEPPSGSTKGLFGSKDSCDWYNPGERGDTTNEFSTAGFRLGHTQVGEAFERYAEAEQGELRQHTNGHVAMRHAFFNNSKILLEGGIEPILRGLANQDNHGHDAKLTYDLGGHLFGPPGPKGLDLVALNIQRGRDHGLPTFNKFREYYNIKTFRTFSESAHNGSHSFDTFLDPKIGYQKEVLLALNDIYNGDARKLDAWVGLLAEARLPGWEWGVTLTKLLADQFKRYRDGDRFFWTNSGVFTSNQRHALSKLTLAGVICANTDIKHIQPNVFKLPITARNSRLPCAVLRQNGAALQNLQAWRGPARMADGTLGNEKNNGGINAVHYERKQISTSVKSNGLMRLHAVDGHVAVLAMVGACTTSDVPPLETRFIQFEAQFAGEGSNPVIDDQGAADDIDIGGISALSFPRRLLQAASTLLDGSSATDVSSQTSERQNTGNITMHGNSSRNVYRRRIADIAGVDETDIEIRLTPKSGILTLSLTFGRQIAQSDTNISSQASTAYIQNSSADAVTIVQFPVTRSSTSLSFLNEVETAMADAFNVDASTSVKTLAFKDAAGDSYGVTVDLEIAYAGIFLQQDAIFFSRYLPVEVAHIVTEVYRLNTTIMYSSPTSSDTWTATQTQANSCVESLATEGGHLFANTDTDNDAQDENANPDLASFAVYGINYGNGPVPLDPLPLPIDVTVQEPGAPGSSGRNATHLDLIMLTCLVVISAAIISALAIAVWYIRAHGWRRGGIMRISANKQREFRMNGLEGIKYDVMGEDVGEVIAAETLTSTLNESLRMPNFNNAKTTEQDIKHAEFIDYTQALSMGDCTRHENNATRSLVRLQKVCNKILNYSSGTKRPSFSTYALDDLDENSMHRRWDNEDTKGLLQSTSLGYNDDNLHVDNMTISKHADNTYANTDASRGIDQTERDTGDVFSS